MQISSAKAQTLSNDIYNQAKIQYDNYLSVDEQIGTPNQILNYFNINKNKIVYWNITAKGFKYINNSLVQVEIDHEKYNAMEVIGFSEIFPISTTRIANANIIINVNIVDNESPLWFIFNDEYGPKVRELSYSYKLIDNTNGIVLAANNLNYSTCRILKYGKYPKEYEEKIIKWEWK